MSPTEFKEQAHLKQTQLDREAQGKLHEFMSCYCYSAYTLNGAAISYRDEFQDYDDVDRNYCKQWFNIFVRQNATALGSSLLIVIINVIA